MKRCRPDLRKSADDAGQSFLDARNRVDCLDKSFIFKYNDPVILVGAKECYEARCRDCFVIDKPVNYGKLPFYFSVGAVKEKEMKL